VRANVLARLYNEAYAPLAAQQAIGTDDLVSIMRDCIRDAEQAMIGNPGYLRLMGFPAPRCEARELWQHLVSEMFSQSEQTRQTRTWQKWLQTILENGPLARRILNALDGGYSRAQLHAVYRELCDCLEKGRMFLGRS
jgi:hypothetical protein